MSIVGDTKEIVNLIRDVDNADLYRKIIDLQGEIYEMHGENLSLKERVRELEERLAKQEELTFNENEGKYYAEGDSVPYCPTCWENDSKAIHMARTRGKSGFHYYCEVCILNNRAAMGGRK